VISGGVGKDVTSLSLPAFQPDSVSRPPSPLDSRESESVTQTNVHPISAPNAGKEVSVDDLDIYIPVGVLKSFNPQCDGSNIDGMDSKASYLDTEVLRLEREKWIKTSICK